MRTPISSVLALLVSLLAFAPARGQDSSGGTFSGRVYSDYYWVAAHHRSDVEGKNGFRFRRIYFTYDYRFDPRWSGRLRLEMDQPGDFRTVTKMEPVVKDAWIAFSPGDHRLELGVTSTPTWGIVGEVWGYRSLERTPLDLYDWGSSRDIGLSAQGPVPGAEGFRYHLMFANGAGNYSEADRGKKVMGAVGYAISDRLIVEGYLDYEETPGPGSVRTAQLFAGYHTEQLRAGLMWATQARGAGAGVRSDLVSAFATAKATNTLRLVARMDRVFDPIDGGESIDYIPFYPSAEHATFLLAGLDWRPVDHLHLVPNLETVFYGDVQAGPDGPLVGRGPKATLLPRLTLFYEF